VKGELAGQQLTGPADLFGATHAFLDEIQKSELEHVFRHWVEHIRWVLNNNGDYFHESTFRHHPSQVLFI
jgi:hypothetical protein